MIQVNAVGHHYCHSELHPIEGKTMVRRCIGFATVLLTGLNLAGPVFAADNNACLQSNRIWGWQAVNDRTLILTDTSYRRYTVNLTGGCIGLAQYAGAKLAVRTKTSLGCVSQGDTIDFNSPAIGPMSCFVQTVRNGVPSAPPGPDAH